MLSSPKVPKSIYEQRNTQIIDSYSKLATTLSSISKGRAMFDIARKCTLYCFWAISCRRPASVHKKELCLFHFFKRLLDMLSHIATSSWPQPSGPWISHASCCLAKGLEYMSTVGHLDLPLSQCLCKQVSIHNNIIILISHMDSTLLED